MENYCKRTWVIGIQELMKILLEQLVIDTLVYPKPYATRYNESAVGTFPAVVGVTGLGQTVYFEHETGTDQINPDGTTTALTSFIQSFEFSLQKDQTEYFLANEKILT